MRREVKMDHCCRVSFSFGTRTGAFPSGHTVMVWVRTSSHSLTLWILTPFPLCSYRRNPPPIHTPHHRTLPHSLTSIYPSACQTASQCASTCNVLPVWSQAHYKHTHTACDYGMKMLMTLSDTHSPSPLYSCHPHTSLVHSSCHPVSAPSA
jgi:hypothetical protein